MSRLSRKRAELMGRRSEWLAGLLLRAKGFAIIARRFKSPGGELDIVAKRGRLVVFAEVKARGNIDDGLFAVTPKNSRRVSAAASIFLARHPHLAACDVRYDIIAVAGWRWRHVKSAWLDSD